MQHAAVEHQRAGPSRRKVAGGAPGAADSTSAVRPDGWLLFRHASGGWCGSRELKNRFCET
jgi:hypothetical protein